MFHLNVGVVPHTSYVNWSYILFQFIVRFFLNFLIYVKHVFHHKAWSFVYFVTYLETFSTAKGTKTEITHNTLVGSSLRVKHSAFCSNSFFFNPCPLTSIVVFLLSWKKGGNFVSTKHH